MDKKKKNNSCEPLDPVWNISTGRIDSAISDNFVMDDQGRVKHRISKDVFVDIESGSLQIVEPLLGKKKK